MRWASVLLPALLVAGCTNSHQAIQERSSTTGSTRAQALSSTPQHETIGVLASLQQWGKGATSAVRSAFMGSTPRAVELCRETLLATAAPYRVAQVEAVRAGPVRQAGRGITTVPINVRVTYVSGHISEVKQARIACWLNRQEEVVELRGNGDRIITSATSLSHEAKLKVADTIITGSVRVIPPLLP